MDDAIDTPAEDAPEQTPLDRVTLAVDRSLSPLDRMTAGWGLVSQHDLKAVVSAFRWALLAVAAGDPGEEAEAEEPRDELGDSKANNPLEQAQLTAALNPTLDIPAPQPGAVQVSSVIEVTAPQSLPTPTVAIPMAVVPVDAAQPTVGQDIGDAVPTTDQTQTEPVLRAIPIVPQPIETHLEDTSPTYFDPDAPPAQEPAAEDLY